MSAGPEQRIRKLERANMVLALPGLAALSLLLPGSASSSQGHEPLRSQRFELLDDSSVGRAVLGVDKDGATGLFIYDPHGGARVSLTHDPEQSALFISDARGTVRIDVAQFARGGGGVAPHGEDSKGATVLYHKDAGSLSFYEQAGISTTRVPPQ
jgi:hypothetical protein